jgi:hypothetical protein
MIKKSIVLAFIFGSVIFASAQSATTEKLHKDNSEALALFFYQNTLRMLNQSEDKAFDDLIKDIEKMKFLMIKKDDDMNSSGYKKLVKDYQSESFESIMTSRYEGKSFDVFVKEKDKKTKGMLVLVNDVENLYVLDIVGSVALNKVTQLYKTLDSSTDIGKKIKAFTSGDDDKKERSSDH